jgi:hypothetical protein
MCRDERLHPVTLEIAEATIDGGSAFQARVRLDGIVFVDVGAPQSSETDALHVIAQAFGSSAAMRAAIKER